MIGVAPRLRIDFPALLPGKEYRSPTWREPTSSDPCEPNNPSPSVVAAWLLLSRGSQPEWGVTMWHSSAPCPHSQTGQVIPSNCWRQKMKTIIKIRHHLMNGPNHLSFKAFPFNLRPSEVAGEIIAFLTLSFKTVWLFFQLWRHLAGLFIGRFNVTKKTGNLTT